MSSMWKLLWPMSGGFGQFNLLPTGVLPKIKAKHDKLHTVIVVIGFGGHNHGQNRLTAESSWHAYTYDTLAMCPWLVSLGWALSTASAPAIA